MKNLPSSQKTLPAKSVVNFELLTKELNAVMKEWGVTVGDNHRTARLLSNDSFHGSLISGRVAIVQEDMQVNVYSCTCERVQNDSTGHGDGVQHATTKIHKKHLLDSYKIEPKRNYQGKATLDILACNIINDLQKRLLI